MPSRQNFLGNLLTPTVLTASGKKINRKGILADASIITNTRQTTTKRFPAQPADALVSVEHCTTYTEDEIYTVIRRSLETIGYTIPCGKSVLLKPNVLAQNTPEQCTTTHPAVVAAVCRLFTENKCDLTIGESSAFYQSGGTEEGLITSGIASVAKRYSAKLLPFETTNLRKITSGLILKPFYLTEAVFTHDMVVNLPKLKLHRLARYTGALKIFTVVFPEAQNNSITNITSPGTIISFSGANR